MWKFLQLLLLSAVLFPGCAKAGSLHWHTLAPMPVAVQEIYPAVHNGKIYVAGGLSDALPETEQQMTDAVQLYDPAMDRWAMAPALPEPRHHAYLVSVANQLFLFGGFVIADGGRWSASSDVLLLDETAQQWRKVAKLPKPLTETVAVVLNGKVHLASGRSPAGAENAQWRDQADVNLHWLFDPQSLSVTDAAPLPQAFNSATGVVLDGQFYVVGGRQVGGANLALLLRFDAATNSWQQLSAMPQAQGGLAAAVLGGDLLVFGGEYFDNDGGVYSQVWRYQVAKDRWQQTGTMPLPRHGLGAVNLNNRVYVLGGASVVGLKATSAVLDVVTQPN
ncbi:Kelch repeat-containing protein [Rheinheimera nanhaiensis]|uniref:Influenza virus NS1A-binding protein n=1 Tax=Rheinheimera nanhaiensis E407-8 TaxID=562729 RepID=I1DTP4_9GAMM|nr:kelch repeat-containing protein [Rheinheimera nanhaiensis]GAB57422.1 influenza virus NS1A-binding protein [Rheinheimera nanhaiensis E407-8]